ncbi:MAG: 16S rRNA (adenine(1518)-N(6)/adenine(1519)-N(6))-dimethyltransferase RsmA [Patescibacteria group bacterium]
MTERIRAKKSLGQHWLADRGAVEKVVDAAGLTGKETVVEVGAGPGVLTPLLAERAKRVIAVELDRTLIPKLEKAVAGHDNVEIRQADILDVDSAELRKDLGPYHVVGNVPYYITSKIIRHFLETPDRPVSMTLTIQAEVAERICALPPKMSVLAVSVQLYGKPRIAGRIPAKAFRPPPDVDSAILRIEDIAQSESDLDRTLDGVSASAVFSFVRAGFSEKRKQLHNTLARNLNLSHEQANALLREAAIDPNRRAETLSVEDWVTLARQAIR